VLHARAITAGDTWLYLPKEKIAITGDMLLSPYPFAIGGTYPASWLAELEKLAALHSATIIPGHGDAQTGTAFLESNIALFRRLIAQVKAAKSQGQTLAQAREAIGNQAPELAAMLGIHDPKISAEFKAYFLDVFVSRAWRELDAPLGNEPDPPQAQ
jgi:glyoxylase-like metal-dependent hydrolase (beta-lactamase superfamily II)